MCASCKWSVRVFVTKPTIAAQAVLVATIANCTIADFLLGRGNRALQHCLFQGAAQHWDSPTTCNLYS